MPVSPLPVYSQTSCLSQTSNEVKHIIILGDGMADHKVERLGGKTPLQYARPEYMNMLAQKGRTWLRITVPECFQPGS